MVYNTKITNKVFYDEGSAGGEWELSIDPSKLNSAASEYTTAAGEYDKALQTLADTLNKALNLWSDKSADTWKGKVSTAQTNLQAVSAAMNKNSKILTEISAAATATETSVANGISSI